MWTNPDSPDHQKQSVHNVNASGSKIHSSKVCRVSEFEEVNTAMLYKWYVLACSKNIFPGGPELIEKAKKIAQQLCKSNFKGSNVWLGKRKARYNIKRFSVCGESGDVQGCTVDSWKERLSEIVAGYKKEDVWNMDESVVFWRALPDKGFGEKGKGCKGGKKSKHRLTVAFLLMLLARRKKPWLSGNQQIQGALNDLIKLRYHGIF